MSEQTVRSSPSFGDYEKAAFRLALARVAQEEADAAFGASVEDEYPESLPRMMKVIEKNAAKRRVVRAWDGMTPAALRWIAAALVILFVCGTAAVAAISTLRARAVRFLLPMTPRYTEITYYGTDEPMDIPEVWTSRYYPSYLPEGFQTQDVHGNTHVSQITLANDNGDLIRLIIADRTSLIRFDTEGADRTAVDVNGSEAALYEKNGISTLTGEVYDMRYVLTTSLSASEALRIAGSITAIRE